MVLIQQPQCSLASYNLLSAVVNSMELVVAEQVRFSAAGRTEAVCSCTEPTDRFMQEVPCPCFPGGTALVSGSPQRLLDYSNPSPHPPEPGLKAPSHLSSISRAGMGIIKTVTSQWRLQERKTLVVRSASTGARYPSPYGQVAAVALQDPRLGQVRSVKPQNCRRLVVLGAPMVGKSSLVRRFLRDGFDERYQPTAEDFHRKLFQIRGESYQLDILDASGERGFPAKRRLSILTGDLFLLVFSLDDRRSLEEVRTLLHEVALAKSKLAKPKEQLRVPTVICGNKLDLQPAERVVSRAEVHQALGEGCTYFETSAKENINLEMMFRALAQKGGLPTETGPSQHRKVSIRSYQALRLVRRGGKANRAVAGEASYGAVCPLARRPSFSTDLRLIVGPRKRSKPLEKCNIQ
ncbi:GTP-binding protein Rhes [Amia ocellicauda]|uniref:GTP-binding protein Rhes n=1 Tax=Amia ocellicauda TaxID=2972642 RepID=UPI003464E15A